MRRITLEAAVLLAFLEYACIHVSYFANLRILVSLWCFCIIMPGLTQPMTGTTVGNRVDKARVKMTKKGSVHQPRPVSEEGGTDSRTLGARWASIRLGMKNGHPSLGPLPA